MRKEEEELLLALLSNAFTEMKLRQMISSARVVDMQDGGMGSIRFVHEIPSAFGHVLAEASYTDSDDVLVSIAVNADKNGHLFELDMWKIDFSALKRYPRPTDLVLDK